MRRLFIIGTGGFAKEVAQLANEINIAFRNWDSIEYICESAFDVGKAMPFGAVVGTDEVLQRLDKQADVAIGIGNPKVRRAIGLRTMASPRLRAPNLVHPAAGLEPQHVHFGQGNIVTRGAALTCDIWIGDFNVFNLNCTVGHDVKIGSFNVVNPGCNISGGCSIGDACLFGTGSQILEGLSVASDSIIGGGAVVVRSINSEGLTHVGIPAKALSR